MQWFVALFLCLAVVALVTGVFIAAVRNARALRRDLNERFDAIEARLERQANRIAEELVARTDDNAE
jgi:hypothetical protein